MLFIETQLFTSLLTRYLSDDDYRELQAYLLEHPEAGPIITGSGGVRKIRWAALGKGKSGGIRVIYYWAKNLNHIYMLTLYSKSEQKDIDKKALEKIAKHLEILS